MKANSEHFNTYEEVIDWLFVQLPNYQAQGTEAYKPGLDNVTDLLEAIDNPQSKFKSIHIAGTNGKGSTAHMLASVYQTAGYKVGIFTSPHIVDFRERVKINGKLVSKAQVFDFVNQTKSKIDELNATFFEITTALAFHICGEQKVDVAIIETGLGGRLDSTNVLLPLCSVITTIGLDHTKFLGDTIEEIAREKAGIIKSDVPVVLGEIVDEALNEIENIALKLSSPVFKSVPSEFETDLLGAYQQENLEVVTTVIDVLQNILPTNRLDIQAGLLNVAKNTRLMGRYHQLGERPKVILDAAHNPDGVRKLLSQIQTEEKGELHLIYGSSNDKELNSVFKLFPDNATYYFCEFDSLRSLKSDHFEFLANQFKLKNFSVFKSSSAGLLQAKSNANPDDIIVVFGSFFMMSELLEE